MTESTEDGGGCVLRTRALATFSALSMRPAVIPATPRATPLEYPPALHFDREKNRGPTIKLLIKQGIIK